MKKIYLLLFFILLFAVFIPKEASAKVWTKDLVDKVTLDSGYKFILCTIDLKYDRTNAADNVFNAVEKDFEANPNSYPCNKQSREDILFANITLNFSKKNWNGQSGPQKLIELQNHLYSVDNYGDVLTDENGKDPIGDISAIDWFSTIPGIHGIRGGLLVNTDPNAIESEKTLPNSNFLIIHDPSTGKFVSALFVFNNVVYKMDQIISQVTVPATLVDYTESSIENLSPTPSDENATQTPTPTLTLDSNLNTYKSIDYPFYFQYPKDFVYDNSSTQTSVSLLQKQDDLMAKRIYLQVDKTNLSLQDFATSKNYNVLEGKTININGKEGFTFDRTFKIGHVCNNGDETEITRTEVLFVKSGDTMLSFFTTNSCETFKTDWFSVILPTIRFTK